MLLIVVGLLVSLSVGLLLLGLGRLLLPVDEIEQLRSDWAVDVGPARGRRGGAAAGRGGLLARVDKAVKEHGLGQSVAAELARADLALTVAEYLAVRLLIAIVGFGIGYLLHRSLGTALLMGLLGAVLPQFYVAQRQSKRLQKFGSQLPDVLERLVGSLRSGYGLLQAVEWVARQMPPPAGAEFERVVRETQLGRSLSQALDSMVRRIDSDDLAMIVTAIQIHQEVGGSLADILETVAETIRERIRIQREIRVLTAQQRFSGYVLIVLPIALAIFLYIINPDYEGQLFMPGPTLCIPIGAGIMMVLGYIAMQRIIKIDV